MLIVMPVSSTSCLIAVGVLQFLIGEQLHINGSLVDGTERERLQLQELTETGLHIGFDDHRVLDAHPKLSGQIESGLIGHRHASHQRRGFPLHTDLMGTLVHIQIGTHAMPMIPEELKK